MDVSVFSEPDLDLSSSESLPLLSHDFSFLARSSFFPMIISCVENDVAISDLITTD